MTHALIANLHKQIEYRNNKNLNDRLKDVLTKVNERLITSCADLFSQYMTKEIDDLEGELAYPLVAKLHRFDARYTLEVALDGHQGLADNLEQQIIEALAEEMEMELRVLARQEPNAQMVPYILADSMGIAIDPISFEPIVRFGCKLGWKRPNVSPLIQNVERNLKHEASSKAYTDFDLYKKVVLGVVHSFNERFGKELFPDDLYMEGPVSRVGNIVVEARNRALDTRWAAPPMPENDTDGLIKEALLSASINATAASIYVEIKQALSRLKNDGDVPNNNMIMVPYMLCGSGLAIDPETWLPSIRFMFRYASIDKNQILQSVFRKLPE